MTNQTVETVKDAAKAVKEVASNAVQTKLITMLDALQNGAVEVGHTVVKYTPDVVDAALWITRINGIQDIAYAALKLVFGIVLSTYTLKLWRWGRKLSYETDGFSFVPSVAVGAAACAFNYFGIQILFSIWVWVEIISPKLYIAKQIVDKVLN